MTLRSRSTLVVLLSALVASGCDAPTSTVSPPTGATTPLLASGGGGGSLPSCGTSLSAVSVTSGGNRGGHSPIPNSMHVFVAYTFRPCFTTGERVDVTITDHVTGEAQQVILPFINGLYGMTYKATSYSSNGKLNHPYDVVITTTNPLTGAINQNASLSLVTNKKL